MTTAAIVPAAGRGERLGPGLPKALRALGGAPLVVVASPVDEVAEVRALLTGHHAGAELVVVAGGDSRQESVRLALAALPADVDVVLVHDAARPLTPVELIDAVAAAVGDGADAVVPALPIADTVKRVEGEIVVETVDRTSLRAVQTPQGFRRSVLDAAHRAAAGIGTVDGPAESTDDAGLIEHLGGTVQVIPGAEDAFKVTHPLDLVLAEAVLVQRRTDGVR